jgi:flagellar motility protein MotE (MotC chaperone)
VAAADVVLDESVMDDGERRTKKEKPHREKKKGGLGWLVVLFVLMLIAALVVLVFMYNPFNLRDQYLAPLLQNVPIVNNLVRPAEGGDPLAGLSRDELAAQVTTLQDRLDTLNAQLEQMKSQNDINVNDLARLRQYEEQQAAFLKDKEDFDRMIAENNLDAYKAFYEEIAPETAETLYREAVGNAQTNKATKDYVATYSTMDAAKAAAIFENLIATDMPLVVQILNTMDKDHRGAILAAMDAVNAASVTKQLAPR